MLVKNIFLILSTLTILCFASCKPKTSAEIIALNSIIERDFSGTPTSNILLPLRVEQLLTYNEYFENSKEPIDQSLRGPEPPPEPGLQDSICILSQHIFDHLLKNNFIEKKAYEKLTDAAIKSNALFQEISNSQVIPLSYKEAIAQKELDKFQVFAYPVMTEDFLIIYINRYSGIKDMKTFGLQGFGQYYIYEKKNGTWQLLTRIDGWIT